MVSLFHNIKFTGHSGQPLSWKIECDALTREDWAWAAARVAERIGFAKVLGVPTGGFAFAEALRPYRDRVLQRTFLLVDDVLTTGGSLREMRDNLITCDVSRKDIVGVVLFARIPPPEPWIKALFVMPEWDR